MATLGSAFLCSQAVEHDGAEANWHGFLNQHHQAPPKDQDQ